MGTEGEFLPDESLSSLRPAWRGTGETVVLLLHEQAPEGIVQISARNLCQYRSHLEDGVSPPRTRNPATAT